jgi:hypothetical protein
MSKEKERKLEKKEVARRFRVICNEEIANLEDQLPYVTGPLERDDLLKQIDALHELADQANQRAEELLAQYYAKQERR